MAGDTGVEDFQEPEDMECPMGSQWQYGSDDEPVRQDSWHLKCGEQFDDDVDSIEEREECPDLHAYFNKFATPFAQRAQLCRSYAGYVGKLGAQ